MIVSRVFLKGDIFCTHILSCFLYTDDTEFTENVLVRFSGVRTCSTVRSRPCGDGHTSYDDFGNLARTAVNRPCYMYKVHSDWKKLSIHHAAFIVHHLISAFH